MRSKLAAAVLSFLTCALAFLAQPGKAADPPKAKVTFEDHVAPICAADAGRATTPTSRRAA